jgi:hypothetical protein
MQLGVHPHTATRHRVWLRLPHHAASTHRISCKRNIIGRPCLSSITQHAASNGVPQQQRPAGRAPPSRHSNATRTGSHQPNRGRKGAAKPPGGRADGGRFKSQLLGTIIRATSIQELQQLLQQHQQRLHPAELACLVNRLAKVKVLVSSPGAAPSKTTGGGRYLQQQQQHTQHHQAAQQHQNSQHQHQQQHQQQQPATAQQVLDQCMPLLAAMAPRFTAAELANILWACAKRSTPPSPPAAAALLDHATGGGATLLHSASPQAISNLAWALSKLGIAHSGAWQALLSCTDRTRLQSFSPFDLSGLAYALALAGQYDTLAFARLAEAAQARLGDCCPQDLANLAWAYATVQHPNEQLFRGIAAAARWGSLARLAC